MAKITLLLKASRLCDQLSINEWNDLIDRYEDDPHTTIEVDPDDDVRIHTTFETVVSKNHGDLRFAEPIVVRKNPNGDTRTAPKGIPFKQFAKANDSHIGDVAAVMERLSGMIHAAGKLHDHTKKEHEREFYDDFTAAMNDGADFVNGTWYQRHVHTERHHPLSYCHDDINLLDILEMVVDCTVAGLARSGNVRPVEVNAAILAKAVTNTAELIKGMVEVEDA